LVDLSIQGMKPLGWKSNFTYFDRFEGLLD